MLAPYDATLPDEPQRAVIFAYEKGATMANDFMAPARRVFFCLNNDTYDDLSEEGLKLFDAAVLWGLGKPCESAGR